MSGFHNLTVVTYHPLYFIDLSYLYYQQVYIYLGESLLKLCFLNSLLFGNPKKCVGAEVWILNQLLHL